MKKLLSIILVLVILLSMLSFGTVGAQTAEDNYTYSVTDKKAIITGVNSSLSGDVIIPSTIDGYLVVSISTGVFHSNESITSVIIPDSVESISWGAFYLCSNLKSVDFGSGVKNIGREAFYGCDSLESVAIPDSVESIGEEAFASCDSLESVTIGNGVVNMGSYTFYQCKGLKDVIIGNSVNTIGEYAFYECENLESVILGNGVNSIGNHAFYSCKSLTAINIPDSVKNIGESAFAECTSLKNLVIGKCVENIETYAFYSCESIESIIFSDSITSIGEYAFSSCDSLESLYITDIEKWCNIDFADYGANPLEDAKYFYINNEITTDVVIPNGVTKIPTYAFSCDSLKSVSIPSSVSSIDAFAFSDCENLMDVWYGGSESDAENINIVYGNNPLVYAEWHYDICEEHEFSSTDCLAQCNNCEWKNPHSEYVVEYDNKNHWKKCTVCNAKVYVEYHDSLSYTENTDTKTHRVDCYCGHKQETETHFFVFKNYEDAFGGYYACGCGVKPTAKEGVLTYFIENGEVIISKADSDITGEVKIPAVIGGCPVVGIGGSAFQYCSGITSVTIPNSVTDIGMSAFEECSALASVILGNGVKSIGNSSFYGCVGLKDVWYVGTQSNRENIEIDNWNQDLTNANWQYNYDAECQHNWKDADCKSPKTCTLCGVTEGKVRGHVYNIRKSNAIEHWNECVCGKQEFDYRFGHGYSRVFDNDEHWLECECSNIIDREPHDFAKLEYDNTYHWNACYCGVSKVVNKKPHTYKSIITKASLKATGLIVKECALCDKIESKTTIAKIKSVKLATSEFVYTGKEIKPKVVVKDTKGNTISSKYYTVSGAKSAKKIGKYKVNVEFKGNYSGSKTLNYEIVKPSVKKSSVSKLTAGKKSLKISIKKASGVSGYEIEYSLKKNFKSSTKKTTTKTSYTIKSLKAKKVYYVRVRSYKKVGGKTFYSGWSSYKSKKTK